MTQCRIFYNWKIKNTEKKISSNPEGQKPERRLGVWVPAVSESTGDPQPPTMLSTWVPSQSPDDDTTPTPYVTSWDRKPFFSSFCLLLCLSKEVLSSNRV